MKKLFSSLIAIGYWLVASFSPVLAREITVDISGNGDSSQNTVTVTETSTTDSQQTNTAAVTNDVTTDSDTGNNSASSNTGNDTTITTGSISDSVTVENQLNSSTVNSDCCSGNSDLIISSNGDSSQNTISVTNTNNFNSTINNTATVDNTVAGASNTGSNSASSNTGGDTSITTGSINVAALIKNYLINQATVNTPENNYDYQSIISGNGAGSVNNASWTDIFTLTSIINNNANLTNALSWDADTGSNIADNNTGGTTSIITGSISMILSVVNGPISIGGINPPPVPAPTPPPAGGPQPGPGPTTTTTTTSGDSGSSVAAALAQGGAVLGAAVGRILPATGSNLILLTLLALAVFALGSYLYLPDKKLRLVVTIAS